MEGFREQNRFLIYLVNFSGLYFKSIEKITSRKWLLVFLNVWTKTTIVLAPIHLASMLKFLIFDEVPSPVKIKTFRRLAIFSVILFKNVFFHVWRSKIEDLIDLWDSSFNEDFYQESRTEKLRENQKKNMLVLSWAWMLTLAVSLLYTVLPFLSEGRKWSHPSGIPHRHQTPDSEILIVFDSVSVTMGILSAISMDCLLMVFLSLVLVQLTHLKEILADMVNEISVDNDGNVVYKSSREQPVEELKISGNISYIMNITRCATSLNNRKTLELVTKNCEYDRCMRKFEDGLRIWIRHHQQTIRLEGCSIRFRILK